MNNLESLKDIIENYSEELKYLPSSEIGNFQALLEDIRNRPKNIWDITLEYPETYYVLNNDGSIENGVFNSLSDENARIVNSAFLTREEAEFELERRKIESIMRKYSRPFKNGGDNYFLYLYNCTSIRGGFNSTFNYGLPCFESEEIAQKVIDEIDEDRLKKYWFGVK
ncbi:MAG: hypothetical protein ACTTKY_00045 [Catonella sp.]